MASYHIRSGNPRLRNGHPMARGLVGAWSFPGGYPQDLVGSNHANSRLANPTYDGALGLKTTGSTPNGISCLATSDLKLQPPFTFVWSGYNPGSPVGQFATIFGVSYDNSGSGPGSPYWGYAFETTSSSSQVAIATSTGTSAVSPIAATRSSGNSWLAGVFLQSGSGNVKLYNGDPSAGVAASGSVTFGANLISYQPTSTLFFGSTYSGAAIPNCYHNYALVYNRSITDVPELSWLYNRGQDLFARPRGHIGWVATLRDIDYAAAYGFTGANGSYSVSGIGSSSSVGHSPVLGVGSIPNLELAARF